METTSINGLTLFYDTEEQDAAHVIGEACQQSVQLMQTYWQLDIPKDCRVYVMTSWFHFIFHSAPWPWQIMLGATLPLWYVRVKRLWPYTGGWAQRYGRRRAVGVKPPRLIEQADRSMGVRIFVKEDDVNEKVRHITCHELVHAFTAHLKLPMWLNEGLAMVTVDKLLGKTTVRPDTIELVEHPPHQTGPGSYRRLSVKNQDALIYHYARGYWLTRYLEETQPDLLRSFLVQRQRHRVLENKVATTLGMPPKKFWACINEVLVAYFQSQERTG
jgi:hypothetical protein